MEENAAAKKIYSSGYAATIAGKNKEINEDFVIFYEKEPEGTVGASNLYVLADGLSGSYHAEVTSRFTGKKILFDYFKSHDFVDANKLALAIRSASNEIYTYAQTQGEQMGTVVVTAAITEGKAVIGSIGDSRVYIVRSGKVYQITEDHHPLEDKVRDGEMTREEAESALVAGKNVRLIGMEKDIVVDVYDGIDVRPGDVLLLCSDGLISYIGKDEILEAAQADTPKEIVENLLAIAQKQESPTDISAIAVKIYDEESIQTVVRQPGTMPEDTDLNKETKELNLIRRSRPRRSESTEQKQQKKLPVWLFPVLLICALVAGGIWLVAGQGGSIGSLFGPRMTATPTIDPVQATLAVIQQTARAEEIIRLSATPTATMMPTATQVPTEVPTFIDLAGTAEGLATSTGATGAGTSLTPEIQATQLPPTPTAVDKDPIVSEKDGADMVYVKAGVFTLGSDVTVDPLANTLEESPQLEVYLDAFWVDKTEVTNKQYVQCVDEGGCPASGYSTLRGETYANLPVSYVTVAQAESYCKWAGKQLPTEIQWEKAARGTDGRIYPWGNDEPTYENALANIPGYQMGNDGTTGLFAVGSFPDGASPYGALDMAGNVWEWTSTMYQTDYYQTLADNAEADSEVVRNPENNVDGTANVIRGGSAADTELGNYQAYVRTTNRSYVNMSSSYYIGFRCILPDTNDD